MQDQKVRERSKRNKHTYSEVA